MTGAGGTQGGIGRFFIGLIMTVTGGYMFLQSITVKSSFGLQTALYKSTGAMGSDIGVTVTSGMILVPFIFGIGMLFYNSKNIIGWLLTIGSMAAFSFGIITSLKFQMSSMSAFNLITIIVLLFGGIGMFLNSLKNFDIKEK
jgi:hypothetical protein